MRIFHTKLDLLKFLFGKYSYAIALGALFFFSFFIRLIGINWDSGHLFHPDERAILMHAYDIKFDSLRNLDFFDSAKSTLNPRWFNYGSFPLYYIKGVSIISNIFLDISIYDLRYPGRITTIFIDSLSVIFLSKIAQVFVNRKLSLLAGLLLSLSLINIQNSHFFTTDIYVTNIILAVIYFSYKNSNKTSVIKGITLGTLFSLGISFKFSFVITIVPIFVSYLLCLRRTKNSNFEIIKSALCFSFSLLISLFIFQPYMFLDFGTYYMHIMEQSKMVRGIYDFPYTRQFFETKSFYYPLVQIFKWGLGPFLSIFCFMGFFYFLYVSLKNKIVFAFLILSWFVPYFFINGSFEVKFTRYFLPLIPFFVLFAVIFLDFLNKKIISKYINSKIANYLLLLLFLIPTLHFSVSFINGIYLNPHPAVQTSKWLELNSKSEEIVVQDHWDESIPRVPHLNFSHERLELYNPDTKEKFDHLFETLSTADYYVIFSNRLYATIPRLDNRYPASTIFYEKLFDGSLGFEVANFQKQSMNLFGINYQENYFERINVEKPLMIKNYEDKFWLNIDLGWSDESFSVYDHPNVMILKNEKKYSKKQLLEILNFNDFNNVNHFDFSLEFPYKKFDPIIAKKEINLYSDQYFLSDTNLILQILFWLFIINLLGIISIPIFYKLFINFPDFGYGFYKFFGLIFFGFIIWILTSNQIISFFFLDIFILLAAFFTVSLSVFIIKRREILYYLSKSKYQILSIEFLFFLTFACSLFIRFLNPDLWHPFRGGEKPMDYAYLNALIRNVSFPPYDPWFSGYTLNYYYFGQYLVALLIKISGIPSDISYNLAIPTFFSYSSIMIFSFVSGFTHLFRKSKDLNFNWFKIPLFSGLFGIGSVLIFGNFDSMIQIYNVILGKQEVFDYWRSTRIISMVSSGLEINEFPFFTFLFADLHAHLLSIPIFVSIITLSFIFYYENFSSSIRIRSLFILILLATLTGCIKATNSWDYPICIFIVLSSISFSNFVGSESWRIKLFKFVFYSVFYLVISRILFVNFDNNFIMPQLGFSISQWKTQFLSILQILFIPISLLSFFLFVYLDNFRSKLKLIFKTSKPINLEKIYTFILLFIILTSLLIFLIYKDILTIFTLLILISLTISTLVIKIKFFENDSKLFLWVAMLLVLGFSIPIFTELFVVKDDINRMNTVFKFNFQSWILLNLAISLLIPFIISEINSRKKRNFFKGLLVILVIFGLSYPVSAIRPRVLDRFDNEDYKLSGNRYMLKNSYSQKGTIINLSDTYYAVDWINNNITGNPVVLEHSTDLYSWSSRISINTGLPTVLGWDWHQKQQRSLGSNSVILRKKQIEEVYSTESEEYILDFLNFYDVELIIFGPVEKISFPNFSSRIESMKGNNIQKIYDKNNFKMYKYNK